MAKRGRHTEGFTLAELLMSVAIVLILAAIAFPSIVSAQNNMRMLELNNAAQSIANAAQAQMTAKKVSGTWVDAVKDGDSYRACFPAARSADVSRETFAMPPSRKQAMNSEKLEQVWSEVCGQVKSYNNIDPSQINAFFSRLHPQAMSDGFLMITADNDFIKTWSERHY
ncbi:type II secretion system protein, partial [Adlercreutzia rubneri]